MKTSLFIIIVFSLFSCQKKEDIANATLKINFANLMNGSPLLLQNTAYTSSAGTRFSIDKFQYYISNIKLKNTQTGQVFVETNSYHLLERKDNTHLDEILIQNAPSGLFDQIEFSVGIDKARNLSTDQVGDLDPSNNMAWDWKTGYKFLLLEGTMLATTGERRGLVYHIGADENYRTITFNLNRLSSGSFLNLESGKTSNLSIDVEVSNLLNSPNRIDIEQNRTVMFGGVAGKVADNYATMFSIRQIQ
jgi:hypothetical protein